MEIVGIILAVVGIGVGIYFGVKSISLNRINKSE